MLNVIRRALYFYHERKDVWATLQHRGMTEDYSWLHSSRRYLELYNKLLPVLLGSGAEKETQQPAPEQEPKPEPRKPHAANKESKATQSAKAEEEARAAEAVEKPKPKASAKPRKTSSKKQPAADADSEAAKKPVARARKPKAEQS
jgi:hypothetical protein